MRTKLFVFAAIIFLSAPFAYAVDWYPIVNKNCSPVNIKTGQTSSGTNTGDFTNEDNVISWGDGCTWKDLTDTIQRLIRFIVNISGLIALVFVLWGGVLLMTAGANPGNQGRGKSLIYDALIGYVLVLLSLFIIDLVLDILGPKLAPAPTSTPTPVQQSTGLPDPNAENARLMQEQQAEQAAEESGGATIYDIPGYSRPGTEIINTNPNINGGFNIQQ